MAGVALPAVLDIPILSPLGFGPFLLGTTAGKIMFSQWTAGQPKPNIDAQGDGPGVGTLTIVTGAVIAASPQVALPAVLVDQQPGGFFGNVHILPRTTVEFGNIITLVTREIEIYSAFREQSVTLNAITNNASPGVVFPDITPPVIVPRETSILSPTSTANDAGTGLGTLVKTTVDALQDGLPVFDTNIIFDFTAPANDPVLFVSGQRIVLIPFKYEVDLIENLEFFTDVIPTLDGGRQSISPRKNARQSFEVLYILEGTDRQRMQALLFDWMDNLFGFPVRSELLTLTADTLVGATQYPVSGADDLDFRIGGLAAVITDAIVFDVLDIQAKTDTLITATSPSQNAYPAGTEIMPLRTARTASGIPTQREINVIEGFRIAFEVDDNDTGALTGDVTPGFWSTFNGRVLFDDCNVVDGSSSGEIVRRLHRFDNKTGKVSVTSLWDRSKLKGQKGFFARTRAEIFALRKLFIGLRGKQKSFYLPTFIEDLTVTADLVFGLATMDIASIGYVRFAKDRKRFSIFRITFTDGTSLERNVLSSATVDVNTERLTVDANWPVTRTVAEIDRLEFYDLVTFDSDKMSLRHRRIGQASTQMPILTAFDDNT